MDLPELAVLTHVPLRMLNHPSRTGDRIPQRLSTHNHLPLIVKEDDRRSRQFAFSIRQRHRLTMLVQLRDAGIRCPQIDANGT